MTVISGIYKRAVIIATNVAEASITLNSLKYVVDNGYSKVNKFKPNLGRWRTKTRLVHHSIFETLVVLEKNILV